MIGSMEREVVHVSPAEAIRDIAAILDRVEHGAEVIVEKDDHPVVLIQPAPRPITSMMQQKPSSVAMLLTSAAISMTVQALYLATEP